MNDTYIVIIVIEVKIEVSTRYRDDITNTAGSHRGPRDEVVYDCMTV